MTDVTLNFAIIFPGNWVIICVFFFLPRKLKTVHVSVQARNEDDLDWKDIMAKVAGASIPGVPMSQANSRHEDGETDPPAVVVCWFIFLFH